ncbi:MAG: dephospho-CoA kinase [Clostridium sp.]|nr:dephospho-CoA kinase [Clostridium sp.]
MKRKIKIGLTGGIASGKTTVSTYAKEKGIRVIDADLVARDVLDRYPEILKYLKKQYGDLIFDNEILNRKKLGDLIFTDIKKRKEYEKVIMPFIIHDIEDKIKEFEKGPETLLIIDAALLFENSLDKEMDFNILVYLDEKTQIKRILKRDKISENQAIKRIESQMTLEDKKMKSDFIIDNSGDREYSYTQFDKIIKEIKKRKKV